MVSGSAQLWYYRLELTSGTPLWCRFAQQRFGPAVTDGSIGEIMLLRRTGSVEDYTDKFLGLAYREADITETQLVQFYTAVLVNPLKTDVALHRPQTVDDAIMFARAYEQRLQLAPSNPRHVLVFVQLPQDHNGRASIIFGSFSPHGLGQNNADGVISSSPPSLTRRDGSATC